MPELETLFSEAIALEDPVQQREFLDSACKDNTQLKNRVGALIQANRRAATFMREPVGIVELDLDDSEASPVGEQPGDVIGRYELCESLGEGGMGTVFLARQREPVQRDVALKVVKPGLDTQEVISRFQSERQALALMDHPNIARAYDAGTTPSGRPFFVMEYVAGTSIAEYCNQQQLDTRQRLELFLLVCEAIQHAHQKGILHRDIKPQNILVSASSGTPQPKIIDFGIAKATKQPLGDNPTATRFGQFIGTPAYMSPEQADVGSVDIDTRSDVYSLGATLYELLVGGPPFDEGDLKQKSSAEVSRVLREKVPPTPSAAISTHAEAASTKIAAARRATPEQLKAIISGDLDWIVMRALDKDRDRRYATVSALADDIRRYLNNEPVIARPPTAGYRLRKFLSRNRIAVITSAVVASTLLLATCVSSGFAYWAIQSLRRAESQSQIAHDENAALKGYQSFLHQGIFAQANPLEEPDRNVTLRFVVDRAAQRLANQDQLRPDVEAAVRTTLGKTYRSLGEYNQSLTHLRRAHDLYLDLARPEATGFQQVSQLQLAGLANELAATLLSLANYEEAKSYLDQSMAVAESLQDSELRLQTMRLLAVYFESIGDLDQAESLLKEIFQQRKSHHGAQHLRTHQAVTDLAAIYQSQGRHDEAIELLEPTYEALDQMDPLDSTTLSAAVRLARLYVLTEHIDQAQELYRESSNDLARLFGEHHPRTLTAKHGLALVQASLQQLPQARQLLEEVLKQQQIQFGDDHPHTLATMHNLARIRAAVGDRDGARELFEEELSVLRQTHGDQDDRTREALSSLAFFHLDQAEFSAAIPYYQQLRDSFPDDGLIDRRRVSTQAMLGLCHLKVDDGKSAREVLEAGLNECKKFLPEDWLVPVIEGLLGEAHYKAGDRKSAELALVNSYEQLKQQEINLPPRWRPMGLRAATRRLAEFYESSADRQQRARAVDYRAEYEHICKFGSIQDEESAKENGDSDTN